MLRYSSKYYDYDYDHDHDHDHDHYHYHYHYYYSCYNHFMALWTMSGTTQVSQYQKVHFAILYSSKYKNNNNLLTTSGERSKAADFIACSNMSFIEALCSSARSITAMHS